jgi:hypothetical protein
MRIAHHEQMLSGLPHKAPIAAAATTRRPLLARRFLPLRVRFLPLRVTEPRLDACLEFSLIGPPAALTIPFRTPYEHDDGNCEDEKTRRGLPPGRSS